MPGDRNKSVLVICSERSGSNLLKAILSEHPSVFVGPPIPLFECFRPIIEAYGDLSVEENWSELIGDVVDLIAVNHQPLPCTITREEMFEATEPYSRGWAAVVRAAYTVIARSQNAEIFGCKFSTNMQDLACFMGEMDFSHVIYQVRDPRDVVLSTMKTGFVDESPETIVRRWQSSQQHARSALAAHQGNVLIQRYEDLLASPRQALERIWSYLELPRCEEALAFHAAKVNQEIATRSHAWANVGKPLMRRNYHKFYKEWNVKDVRVIESIVAPEMRLFDYKQARRFLFRSTSRRPEKRVLSDAENEFFRPQAEKWEEIKRRAQARMEKTAC